MGGGRNVHLSPTLGRNYENNFEKSTRFKVASVHIFLSSNREAQHCDSEHITKTCVFSMFYGSLINQKSCVASNVFK